MTSDIKHSTIGCYLGKWVGAAGKGVQSFDRKIWRNRALGRLRRRWEDTVKMSDQGKIGRRRRTILHPNPPQRSQTSSRTIPRRTKSPISDGH